MWGIVSCGGDPTNRMRKLVAGQGRVRLSQDLPLLAKRFSIEESGRKEVFSILCSSFESTSRSRTALAAVEDLGRDTPCDEPFITFTMISCSI